MQSAVQIVVRSAVKSVVKSASLAVSCNQNIMVLQYIQTFLSRLQKEKDDALADIDCKREQYDKLQVGRRDKYLFVN